MQIERPWSGPCTQRRTSTCGRRGARDPHVLEVGVFYVPAFHPCSSRSARVVGREVQLVVMFYMHLKADSKFFTSCSACRCCWRRRDGGPALPLSRCAHAQGCCGRRVTLPRLPTALARVDLHRVW